MKLSLTTFAPTTILLLAKPSWTYARLDAIRRLRRLSTSNNSTELDADETSSEDTDGNCQDKYVLLLGENLFNPLYSAFTYETALPKPMDQDFFNLPLFDAEDFLENDGTQTQIGTVQEHVLYLPSGSASPITEDTLECLGREVWTFDDGQVSDSYTCQGPLDGSMITGGGGSYECATGYTDLIDISMVQGTLFGNFISVPDVAVAENHPNPMMKRLLIRLRDKSIGLEVSNQSIFK